MSSVFANGPGDRGSIPGRALPMPSSTQYYMVRIKSKVEQSWEWSSALPFLSVVAIEKRAFGSPSSRQLYFYLIRGVLVV